MAIGKRCAEDIRLATARGGLAWADVGQLLDFGCGSGRTLVWLKDTGPETYGCDRDGDCVAWCGSHLSGVSVTQNAPIPPLDYREAKFDLVYAVSVFTHLTEAEQDLWLAELRRVTRPGGIALFSFHGPSVSEQLADADQVELAKKGILALPVRGLWGLFPSYYNTYHTESYVRERWTQFGDVVEVMDRGMNAHQDLAILKRT